MLKHILQLSLITLLFILFSSNDAHARKRGFISFGGDVMHKVADFPDNEMFQMDDGTYMDAGIIHKEVSIVFIPIWNYDVKWCGYVNGDTYVELTKEELDVLAEAAGVTLPESLSIPFWNSIGGKLVFLAIIGALIAYGIFSSDDEEEEETPAQPEATGGDTPADGAGEAEETPKQ